MKKGAFTTGMAMLIAISLGFLWANSKINQGAKYAREGDYDKAFNNLDSFPFLFLSSDALKLYAHSAYKTKHYRESLAASATWIISSREDVDISLILIWSNKLVPIPIMNDPVTGIERKKAKDEYTKLIQMINLNEEQLQSLYAYHVNFDSENPIRLEISKRLLKVNPEALDNQLRYLWSNYNFENNSIGMNYIRKILQNKNLGWQDLNMMANYCEKYKNISKDDPYKDIIERLYREYPQIHYSLLQMGNLSKHENNYALSDNYYWQAYDLAPEDKQLAIKYYIYENKYGKFQTISIESLAFDYERNPAQVANDYQNKIVSFSFGSNGAKLYPDKTISLYYGGNGTSSAIIVLHFNKFNQTEFLATKNGSRILAEWTRTEYHPYAELHFNVLEFI